MDGSIRERFAVLAREILTVEIGAAVESQGREGDGHGRRRCMPRDEWTHKLRRRARAATEAIKFEISIPDRTTTLSFLRRKREQRDEREQRLLD